MLQLGAIKEKGTVGDYSPLEIIIGNYSKLFQEINLISLISSEEDRLIYGI